MKWLVVILLLAGCVAPQQETVVPTEICDEDHFNMYIAPGISVNGTLVEENGLNILTIYRFQCDDELRELWGLELVPEDTVHKRWLLKSCGFWVACKGSSDFKIDGDVLLEQFRMTLYEEHIFTLKVAKTDAGRFPGYTSEWVRNGQGIVTTHGIGNDVGTGTFTMTPIPWEHYGIYGSPENFVHLVENVPLQWHRINATT